MNRRSSAARSSAGVPWRPQLFRARTSNTSTMSSTMSGILAPVALTASFQAPAGPEASPLARRIFDCGHGAGLATRYRERRDTLDPQIEIAIPAREAIRLERELHLDLLARGGLLELLP